MRRQERWILLLGFGGFILMAAATFAEARMLVAPASLMTGIGAALSITECQRRGTIETTWGVYRRAECRACFLFQLGWWWSATILWTIGGVLFAFGFLAHR